MFNLYIQNYHVILGPTIFFSLPHHLIFFPQSRHEEKIRSNQQQEHSFPQWVGTPLPPTVMACAVNHGHGLP
jgi:hypothetical protein